MMKIYNTIFLSLVFFVVCSCAAIMLWSQPITGDLTRISGYPERWFGWNTPQQNITPTTNTPRKEDASHILVVGDSFSEAGYWQSFLKEKYTFSFIHSGKTNLNAVIARIAQEKIDAVVIETVERSMYSMYGSATTFTKPLSDCQLPLIEREAPPDASKLYTHIAELPLFPDRSRITKPISGNNISEGFHTFKLNSEAFFKPRKRKAKILALTSSNLFSNTRSDQLLSLSRDFLLYNNINEVDLNMLHCTIRATAQALAATQIPFVILTLPDKTTAYQPYLADEKLRQKTSLAESINMNAATTHGVDMLPAIRTLIAAGDQDIYLPNDTHWGYRGFQLAAVLIDEKLAPQLPNSTSTTNTHD